MTITAKYATRCATCGQSIAAGEKIEWAKGSPARHTSCSATTTRPATTTRAAAPKSSRSYRGPRTGCSCGSREDTISQYDCESCRFDLYDC